MHTETFNDLMNEKINTQSLAMSAIRGRQYIIGSVSHSGAFSIATNPVTHDTLTAAKMECRRLARVNTGVMYVALMLNGAELVPTDCISI